MAGISNLISSGSPKTKSQLSGITNGVTVPNKAFFEDKVHQYIVDIVTAMIADRRNPIDYGAKFDAVRGTDGAISSSDATFTSSGSTFTSSDVGKSITVQGAGSGGAILKTTIASINTTTSVELTATASTTVSSANFSYGTDDATAIKSAYDDLATDGMLVLPFGKSYIGSSLAFDLNGVVVMGMGFSNNDTAFTGTGGATELIKGFNGDCIAVSGNNSILGNLDVNSVANGSGDGIVNTGIRNLFPNTSSRNHSGNNFVGGDVKSGLTAGTTQTQAGGLDLTSRINEVSTVANTSDTVVLFAAYEGAECIIINNGANALRIYPASGDNLGSGANTVMTTNLATTDMIKFIAYDATNWRGFREPYVI